MPRVPRKRARRSSLRSGTFSLPETTRSVTRSATRAASCSPVVFCAAENQIAAATPPRTRTPSSGPTTRFQLMNSSAARAPCYRYPVPMVESHLFHAIGFVENLNLKMLAAAIPEAERTAHELWYPTPGGGTVFAYPFGAMVLLDVP